MQISEFFPNFYDSPAPGPMLGIEMNQMAGNVIDNRVREPTRR